MNSRYKLVPTTRCKLVASSVELIKRIDCILKIARRCVQSLGVHCHRHGFRNRFVKSFLQYPSFLRDLPVSPVFSLPRDTSIFKKLCLFRKLSVVSCRIFFSQRAVPPSFQCPLIVVPSRKLLRGDRGPFIVINRKKRCSRGCVYSDVQSVPKALEEIKHLRSLASVVGTTVGVFFISEQARRQRSLMAICLLHIISIDDTFYVNSLISWLQGRTRKLIVRLPSHRISSSTPSRNTNQAFSMIHDDFRSSLSFSFLS